LEVPRESLAILDWNVCCQNHEQAKKREKPRNNNKNKKKKKKKPTPLHTEQLCAL